MTPIHSGSRPSGQAVGRFGGEPAGQADLFSVATVLMVARMTAEATARALLARARWRSFALPARNVEIAALDWGGDGPLALLHHANGFCKGVWGLVAEALRSHWRVVAIDARGHGDSSKPEGPNAYAWDHFAEDLLGVAGQLSAERGGAPIALGIGNSFGGTSLIGAAARRGDLFEHLLLVDPVIPPPPDPHTNPARHEHFRRLVDGALRRRANWPSRAAARAWCAERSLFAGWRSEAIELYLLDGMRELADGSLELKCPGAIEAAVFAGSATLDILTLATRVPCPTRFLWAEHGDFPRPLYEAVAASMPAARVDTVACGHLVPMQCPELVVAAAGER
jgi:pimeloyl-ACP methyl ester carboxylesterase